MIVLDMLSDVKYQYLFIFVTKSQLCHILYKLCQFQCNPMSQFDKNQLFTSTIHKNTIIPIDSFESHHYLSNDICMFIKY